MSSWTKACWRVSGAVSVSETWRGYGNNLFYGELQPLLHGYIEEAISFGSAPVINNKKIKEYLDPILTNESSQEEYLKKNGKVYKYKDKVVHITGYAQ